MSALSLKIKILIALGVFIFIFGAGFKVSAWKYQAEQLEIEQQYKNDLEKQRADIIKTWEDQRAKDDEARQKLAATLGEVQERNLKLLEDLNNVEILPPETVVKWRERVVESDCSEQSLASFNPFSAEFVSVWNRTSNQSSSMSESTRKNEAPGGDETKPRSP